MLSACTFHIFGSVSWFAMFTVSLWRNLISIVVDFKIKLHTKLTSKILKSRRAGFHGDGGTISYPLLVKPHALLPASQPCSIICMACHLSNNNTIILPTV